MTTFSLPRQRLLGVVLTLALAGVTHAGQAATEAQYQSAMKHFLAADADKAEVKQAYQAFDTLRAAEPTDPVLLVYTGSAQTRMATTVSNPMEMLAYVDNGVAQIEKAVALLTPAHDAVAYGGESASLTVRYVAASTFLALPSNFHKGPRGAKLLEEALASPAFAKASPEFQGNILLRAASRAQQMKQSDQARKYAGTIVDRKLPQAAEAQTLLGKLDK
jgi:hypothetical protein